MDQICSFVDHIELGTSLTMTNVVSCGRRLAVFAVFVTGMSDPMSVSITRIQHALIMDSGIYVE